MELYNPKIIRSESAEGVITVNLLDNGIVEMNWDESLSIIHKTDLQTAKKLVSLISDGQLLPVYVSTFNFMNITEEAKEFAAGPDAQEFTLANAVLIDNLGKKLLFNFFVTLNRPMRPTKGFTSKEKAFKWLLEIAAQSNEIHA